MGAGKRGGRRHAAGSRAEAETRARLQKLSEKNRKRGTPYLDVEYNMDEADDALLEHLREDVLAENKHWQGKTELITRDVYEMVMDRLEKEYYYVHMQALLRSREEESDANRACDVCGERETANDNFLVFCDGCDIAVHQACYGIPYIPEDSWLCRPCLLQPSKRMACVMCPAEGGAFKQTSRGGWCHVVCVLFIPELRFENAVFMEPIDGVEDALRTRRGRGEECSVCRGRKGVKVECSYRRCGTVYHVGCGANENLYMDSANGVSYCRKHDPREAVGRPFMDFAFRQMGRLESAKSSGSDGEDYPHLANTPVIRSSTKLWLPTQRFSVVLQRTPPVATDQMINRIVFNDLSLDVERGGKSELVKTMAKIWATRRAELKGYPLVKRLRTELRNFKDLNAPWEERDFYLKECIEEVPAIKKKYEELGDKVGVEYLGKSMSEHREIAIYCTCAEVLSSLSATVEKLLSEGQREGRRRRRAHAQFRERYCEEWTRMERMLAKLRKEDPEQIFEDPVTEDIAPEYFSMVSHPICFKDVERKVREMDYNTVHDLERDIEQMVANCYTYNGEQSSFSTEGRKVEKKLKTLMRKAREREVADGEIVYARMPGYPYLIGTAVKKNVPREKARTASGRCTLIHFHTNKKLDRWVYNGLIKKRTVPLKSLNRGFVCRKKDQALIRECVKNTKEREKDAKNEK